MLAGRLQEGSPVSARNGCPTNSGSAVDRGRLVSKHHLISDVGGVPLAVLLTGRNQRRHPVAAAGDPTARAPTLEPCRVTVSCREVLPEQWLQPGTPTLSAGSHPTRVISGIRGMSTAFSHSQHE